MIQSFSNKEKKKEERNQKESEKDDKILIKDMCIMSKRENCFSLPQVN